MNRNNPPRRCVTNPQPEVHTGPVTVDRVLLLAILLGVALLLLGIGIQPT